MFHIAGCASWAEGTTVGRTHVFVPRFTALEVATAIERHHVTDTLLVPTMVQMLVDSPETAEADLSSLRTVVYSASPMSEAVLERAVKRMPTTKFIEVHPGLRHDGDGSGGRGASS